MEINLRLVLDAKIGEIEISVEDGSERGFGDGLKDRDGDGSGFEDGSEDDGDDGDYVSEDGFGDASEENGNYLSEEIVQNTPRHHRHHRQRI